MLKNYLKIGIRNLLIHKKYSLINILGFAIGFTGFILIMLWVQDELSYDMFHKNTDNTYLVLRASNNKVSAVTSKMLGPAIKAEIPDIVNETDYSPLPESFKPFLQYKEKGFEENFALTDPHFFEVFSFKFIKGNPQTAFNDPNSIVMTERMADKYFGSANAIGKSLTITFLGQKKILKVTGVIDNIPHNTYFQKDLLLPMDFQGSVSCGCRGNQHILLLPVRSSQLKSVYWSYIFLQILLNQLHCRGTIFCQGGISGMT